MVVLSCTKRSSHCRFQVYTHGLILGVLPLLISTTEHFDDIAQPFRRYRRFHDVKKFHGSLQTQKTIFRNFCELLLKSVVNNDVAVTVLDRGIDASEELDRQLSVVLESSPLGSCRLSHHQKSQTLIPSSPVPF